MSKTSQLKALLMKNYKVLLKQKANLICQFLNPIISLVLVFLLKNIVELTMSSKIELKQTLPIIFNVPYYKLDGRSYNEIQLDVSSCSEWYLYDYDSQLKEDEINYFENYIIKSKYTNYYFCKQINKKIPYYNKSLIKEDLSSKNKGKIRQDLYNRLKALNLVTLSLTDRFEKKISVTLPDGAISVSKASSSKLDYKIFINENRYNSYHQNNFVSRYIIKIKKQKLDILSFVNNALWLSNLVNKSYINSINENIEMSSGIIYFDTTLETSRKVIQMINVSTGSFIPISLSLIMPIFLYTIVHEKEYKISEYLKINGMKMSMYWLSIIIFNMMFYLIIMTIFFLFGYFVFGFPIFTKISLFLQLIIIIGWGLNQISFAIFLQTFLNKAKTSSILGYILSVWLSILAIGLNIKIFRNPRLLPEFLLCIPSFNIVRTYYVISGLSYVGNYIDDISMIPKEISNCLFYLYLSALIYFLLGIYLFEVVPRTYGVRRSIFFIFPVSTIKRLFKYLFNVKSEELNNIYTQDILDYSTIEDNVLCINNVTKRYAGSKVNALTCLNMAISKNEILGLVGHNGAGKSTLFSILTGFISQTSGYIFVDGLNIRDNIDKVRKKIGFCPQFDILWDNLTIEDHLVFYSYLKYDKVTEKDIDHILNQVNLYSERKKMVSELSGGMRRRLSIGVSLLGDSKLILLDEPTTGLDPDNRREIWNILQECKNEKSLLITSHLMEEIDLLSDKICLVNKGKTLYFGQKKDLRSKDLKLKVVIDDTKLEENKIVLNNIMFTKFKGVLLSHNTTSAEYKLLDEHCINIRMLYDFLDELKTEKIITKWFLSNFSLEDCLCDKFN